MHILGDQLVFFATLTWLFVVPGVIFVRVMLGRNIRITPLELFVSGFGIGVILVDIILIVLDKSLQAPLSRTTVFLAPLCVIMIAVALLFQKKPSLARITSPAKQNTPHARTFTALAGLLIILTILIKTFYLTDTAFPTATDMGHHLYWVDKIATSHQLQPYEKQVLIPSGDTYTISEPQPIADFIIGEHIPLAAVQILTGHDVLAPDSVLFLFALDVLSVLALFVLALRIFAGTPHVHTIALAVLFLMGPLYTISASQAKFVAGGVIGNLFGNFLIPLALLFLYRALHEKAARFLALFLLTTFGLVYTHHLSTFIFAYVLAFTVGIFVLLNLRTLGVHIATWWRLLFAPLTIAVLALAAFFALSVYLPNYLNPDAIASATGAPSKATRTGVALAQLAHTVGEARFAFALVGLAVLFFASLRTRLREKLFPFSLSPYAIALLLAWPLATLAMSTVPQYLGVNIISSRIANYTILPFALVGGVGLWWLLSTARAVLPRTLATASSIALLLFPLTGGMYDNNQSLKTIPAITPALETFAAARYSATHITPDAWALKDHNYLTADTWMKLFYLRDYNYPLSRSYFKRYANPNRETCTREMISAPARAYAQQCFRNLNVRHIIVDPDHDAAQFMEAPLQFDRIYSSDHVTIFARKD